MPVSAETACFENAGNAMVTTFAKLVSMRCRNSAHEIALAAVRGSTDAKTPCSPSFCSASSAKSDASPAFPFPIWNFDLPRSLLSLATHRFRSVSEIPAMSKSFAPPRPRE